MVCPPATSSNNHDLQTPELTVGDTDCKWMSGPKVSPYVRQRAVYAALAKVAGGLSDSISTPWRRLMHSTRYCPGGLGEPPEHSPARLSSSSWRYLAKLHEVCLHHLTLLVGGGSNTKCATPSSDARSSTLKAQPRQLARFHPLYRSSSLTNFFFIQQQAYSFRYAQQVGS